VLIDGSGFIFRAFHALPPLTRGDGTPVGAVLGFTNMLLKLLEDTEAEKIAVLFDFGRATFRNDLYPQYKANREEPPEDLIPQFSLVREATRACNLPAIEMEGFEADDLIATYARQAVEQGAEVTIVSSDKDLMQLVSEHVTMLDPIKNRRIGRDQVEERFGVPPEKVVDVMALAGDPTDNVPGVPGIGVKTAATLIREYGDLDRLLARASEIPQPKRRERLINHAEDARLARKLVRLRADVPVKESLTNLAARKPDPERLLAFLREYGFKAALARTESRLAARGEIAAPAHHPPAETNYELVTEEARLNAWIAAAQKSGVVALDTETTSLDAMAAELVGFSLSLKPGRAAYVPLAHIGSRPHGELDLGDRAASTAPRQIAFKRALAMLKPLLADPAVLKVGHNIKYDMHIFARYGLEVTPIDDTMLLSYVLEGGLHGHSLDDLAALHFGHRTIKYKEVTGSGKSQIGFAEVGLEAARDYAAEDADFTGRLWRALKPRLLTERMCTVYETLERPLAPVLAGMERRGVRVDEAALKALSSDFAARMETLEAEIHGLAGHPFNVGSPKQLGEVLFDEMSLPGARKSGKSGDFVTNAEVLEQLTAAGHDLPARVLDWRQIAKLKNTYTDALARRIDRRTGRVHTSYLQAVASTGRLASSDPNLQNIPIRTEEGRKIRHAFVPEAGFTFLSADYSQIELRLLAHVAEIETLKQAFRDNIDIHALTASQVFGVPAEGIDPQLRRRAKAINFGIIYGISPVGLARQLGIERAEAAAYIRAYFERYPGIRDYMERTKEEAREKGFVRTLFGRKCHTPGIRDKNPNRRAFAERAAINAPLQGAAADIIKRAMIRMEAALSEHGLGARMLLQVHDELLFEVPDSELKATAAVVKRVMEEAPKPAVWLEVPLIVEVGTGPNWEAAH
jgi:DNA polymerase-1